jgi:hypothetical protein
MIDIRAQLIRLQCVEAAEQIAAHFGLNGLLCALTDELIGVQVDVDALGALVGDAGRGPTGAKVFQ